MLQQYRRKSPVLNELTAQSVHFKNAYNAISHIPEAMPSLLTREYSEVAGDDNYQLATNKIASTPSVMGFATSSVHSNTFNSRVHSFERRLVQFNDNDLQLAIHKLIALAQWALGELPKRHYLRIDEVKWRLDALRERGQSDRVYDHTDNRPYPEVEQRCRV